MSRHASKEREFHRFREMLMNDPGLREIMESATSPWPRMPRYEDWLIPYVNAPRLKRTPWK